MPKKKDDGFWHVNIRPAGAKGPQFKRKFRVKAKALEFEAGMLAKYHVAEEWEREQSQDNRRLSDLVQDWYDLHGNALQDGDRRLSNLKRTCLRLGNPIARNLRADDFSEDRANRAKETSVKTANRDHAYLRAVYNELKRLGRWKGENPISGIKAFKEPQAELCYFDISQLKVLLKCLDESKSESVKTVVEVCLSTGARWDEAQSLKKEQVKGSAIQFYKTKSGKRRLVPISEKLNKKLKDITPFSGERLFSKCLSAFRRAIEKSGLPSPRGQMTHVLRHSFAVHFIQKGGNIKDLQLALGHSEITTTMIYLQFAPQHLESVPKLNPINFV